MVEQPRLSDVEAKLCRMVRDIIEESLQYNWLHRTAKPIIDIGLSQEVGATDAIIFRANVNIELFVKFHPENATRENNGYNILLQGPNEFTSHLVPPLPTRGNIPLWLTPLVDATTLHDLACRPGKSAQFDQWLRRLYEDFFSAMKALWFQTRKTSTPPDFRQIYANRIWDRIALMEQGFNIPSFKDLVIKVNGVKYDVFENLMANFEERMNRLSASVHSSCTLHGDEHAKNIMVFRNAIGHNPTGWVIVDYVNAKKEADWIFSIAKMLFWWQFYCVLELAKQDSSIRETLKAAYDTEELKHNRLIITYDEKELERQVPARCRDLQQMVLTFAQTIAAAFGEDPMEFHQRLKLALFSVIFASAPIHFGKADFVVPIMIGESLKHL
ncbi:MAG TPA: hypothetical protein VEL49_11070 [Ktedonobacteraceae bacterium]|nr:hypothetical protein [Ktedonobacteraceae bacterium]